MSVSVESVVTLFIASDDADRVAMSAIDAADAALRDAAIGAYRVMYADGKPVRGSGAKLAAALKSAGALRSAPSTVAAMARTGAILSLPGDMPVEYPTAASVLKVFAQDGAPGRESDKVILAAVLAGLDKADTIADIVALAKAATKAAKATKVVESDPGDSSESGDGLRASKAASLSDVLASMTGPAQLILNAIEDGADVTDGDAALLRSVATLLVRSLKLAEDRKAAAVVAA
jgi:hypothetical protein